MKIKHLLLIATFSVSQMIFGQAIFTVNDVCERDSALFINGSANATSYLWKFGDGSISAVESPKHLYPQLGISQSYKVILIIDLAAGGKDSMEKNIEVKQHAKADFNAKDVCEGDTLYFTNKSTGAERYNWKFGDAKTSIETSPKHLYEINGIGCFPNVTLIAVNSNGCSDSISKPFVVNANPRTDFTYTISDKTVFCNPSQPGNTKYSWLFGDGDSSNLVKPTHTFSSPPYTICLKVTNAAGCSSKNCITIKIGTTTEQNNSRIKLFPNPSTGNFTIEIDNPEKDILIEVYNSVGESVKRVEMVGKITTINLDVASGIYLVKVRNGEMEYNQKVSIVK